MGPNFLEDRYTKACTFKMRLTWMIGSDFLMQPYACSMYIVCTWWELFCIGVEIYQQWRLLHTRRMYLVCTPWDPAAPACLSEIACKSDWMGFMVSSWFPAAGMHNHNQSQLANISQDFTSLDLKSKDWIKQE